MNKENTIKMDFNDSLDSDRRKTIGKKDKINSNLNYLRHAISM